VTWLLAGACLALSGLTLFPGLSDRLGDAAANPVVRLLTAPFVHGFSPGSLLPHLAGNLLLLTYAGSRVEPALGSRRFALLTGGALAAYAMIQWVRPFEVQGASVFIWAYGPPLAVMDLSRRHRRGKPVPPPTRVVLAVMWVVVPLLMTTVPYAFGWSGSVVGAFLVANTFHLSATAVGAVGAWTMKGLLMAKDETAELAVGWIEAWVKMDLAWLRRHLSPTFVHTSPFGRLEGRDFYLDTVEPMARKSVQSLEIKHVVVGDNQAAVWFENKTPKGVIPSCDWVRVEDGMIASIQSFYDSALVREVLSPAEQEGLGGAGYG